MHYDSKMISNIAKGLSVQLYQWAHKEYQLKRIDYGWIFILYNRNFSPKAWDLELCNEQVSYFLSQSIEI